MWVTLYWYLVLAWSHFGLFYISLAKLYGFDAIKPMKHIKEEMSIAFGTSSLNLCFPINEKLESFGCSKKSS